MRAKTIKLKPPSHRLNGARSLAENQGQGSVGSIDKVETDGRARPTSVACPLTRSVNIARRAVSFSACSSRLL